MDQKKQSATGLTWADRINYGIGGAGINGIKAWFVTFFAIFCTDVAGVSAAVASALVLGVRLFDAVNDPIIGGIADKSKLDKNGNRYAKWIKYGGFSFALSIIAIYVCRPGWSNLVKCVWICLFYCISTVCSTATEMPYGAVMGLMSEDGRERTKLASTRTIFDCLSNPLIGVIAYPMIAALAIGGKTENGYLLTVIITCAVGSLFTLWCSAHIKEVIHPPVVKEKNGRSSLKSILKNKYMVCIIVGQFTFGVLSFALQTMLTYFFTYYAGNANYLSVWSVCAMVAAFPAAFISSKAVSICKGHKGKAIFLLGTVAAVIYVGQYFLVNVNWIFFVFSFLGLAVHDSCYNVILSSVGDAADFGELKFGERNDGLAYAFYSFANKCGSAFIPALLIALIGWAGYVPNGVQNETVLNIMHVSITLVPAIAVALVGVSFILLFNMSEEMHIDVVNQLHKMRNQVEQK